MVRKMARKAAKPTNQNKEFFEAIQLLEQERGIPADYLLEKVCAAIVTSLRKEYGEDVVFVDCDPEKKELRVYLRKIVVDVVENSSTEILPGPQHTSRQEAPSSSCASSMHFSAMP